MQNNQRNEIDLKVLEARRCMGLEVHQDGVKKVKSLEQWVQAIVNFMVQLEERLPSITFWNREGNLSLMEL